MSEVALDGKTCLYNAEGRAANLPMGSSPHTIEAWIKPTGTGRSDGGIVGWGSYWRYNSVNALRLKGWNGLRHYWWSNDIDAVRTVNLADGNWNHVVATFDGHMRSIFVDFQLVSQAEAREKGPDHLHDKSNFCVGKTVQDEYFTGSIDRKSVV